MMTEQPFLCPFARGNEFLVENIGVDDPCPVCGDKGDFDQDSPSKCRGDERADAPALEEQILRTHGEVSASTMLHAWRL